MSTIFQAVIDAIVKVNKKSSYKDVDNFQLLIQLTEVMEDYVMPLLFTRIGDEEEEKGDDDEDDEEEDDEEEDDEEEDDEEEDDDYEEEETFKEDTNPLNEPYVEEETFKGDTNPLNEPYVEEPEQPEEKEEVMPSRTWSKNKGPDTAENAYWSNLTMDRQRLIVDIVDSLKSDKVRSIIPLFIKNKETDKILNKEGNPNLAFAKMYAYFDNVHPGVL
jgi:hypothetical protein